MQAQTLRRFTGEVVGNFGTPLPGVPCEYAECTATAVILPCNAEGDKGRAHWHGGLHDLSHSRELDPVKNPAKLPSGFGALCETHGLEVLANNERMMRFDA